VLFNAAELGGGGAVPFMGGGGPFGGGGGAVPFPGGPGGAAAAVEAACWVKVTVLRTVDAAWVEIWVTT